MTAGRVLVLVRRGAGSKEKKGKGDQLNFMILSVEMEGKYQGAKHHIS